VTLLRRGGRTLLVLTLTLVAVFGAAAPVAADEPAAQPSEAQRVIDVAMAQLGARWVFSAVGPKTFDCSGLVTFAFREAGLLERIGGKRRTVAGYYQWFNSRGLADKMNPRPGDLVVWGKNKHIGIYLGDGKAISALLNPYGVKVHAVKGYVPIRLKAYLHVNLER
jgi:cell wall-associated NlpC family hydrolase